MGSLVAALASYLDAKVHQGKWLVRIEDLDWDRNVAGAGHAILAALQRCGMQGDGEVVWQSQRTALYEAALQQLGELVYPCACSRKEILDSRTSQDNGVHGVDNQHAAALVYPGTCRGGLAKGKTARALRVRVPRRRVCFNDRWEGEVCQDLDTEAGDFVVRRADGFWAYQLAVVVDDAAQGVTHIVRGADLLDSTPRQVYLQEALGLPHPVYLHVPVVTNAQGEKLSKQTGARAFDQDLPQSALLEAALLPAAKFLGLELRAYTLDEFWRLAVPAWGELMEHRAAALARGERITS
jgi:glutamyl-Q tRNA(Asp) synthetase